MGTDKISFLYKGEKYTLDVSEYYLVDSLEVSYDEECRYKNDEESECDHDYNRCMEINNISKNGYKLYEYVSSSLTNSEGDNALKTVVELVVRSLRGISFEDYIDCSTEGGYYGESLNKTLENKSELIERILTNLATEDFKNIKLE